jgi:hypothetical protein
LSKLAEYQDTLKSADEAVKNGGLSSKESLEQTELGEKALASIDLLNVLIDEKKNN